jgi:hypothetical protein
LNEERNKQEMKYKINYGFGVAILYTPNEDWKSRFYNLSDQCFGIRKNVTTAELISQSDEQPKYLIQGEYERLEHDGDIIVWNEAGEKIKSEWDD